MKVALESADCHKVVLHLVLLQGWFLILCFDHFQNFLKGWNFVSL